MSTSSEILGYLREQEQAFITFLKTLALCESPSNVPQSQTQMRELLIDAFSELDYQALCLNGRDSGGHLYARPTHRVSNQQVQLILGHYDTVWPVGTLQEMPFEAEANVIRGPGVYDMKGGIAQIIFALKALRAAGIDPPVTPVVFLNSDEEIGSRESRRHIYRLAPCMDRVYVLEPSLGLQGKLKTARKGVGRFYVVVKGKAAHAGLDPEAGASAILEMSHVIQSLFALNDADKGVTVNVGTVDGGLRPNMIAPESKAVLDVRVLTQADAERVEQAILSLKPTTPGVSLEINGAVGRPPMEPNEANQALWELAYELGEEIGLTLEQGTAGGGSDGNLTSPFAPTLDGLGAVGDGAHAHHEFLYVDKTLERAALLALLLAAPSLNDLLN
ncbi:MAG: M20 family metallopeptidase [Gammaproteobacteria bacterium]|nr:M20 family metallopeptidase [Gammaproteobacteria bacterium]